jgi:uncharacterized membrane protein YgcG
MKPRGRWPWRSWAAWATGRSATVAAQPDPAGERLRQRDRRGQQGELDRRIRSLEPARRNDAVVVVTVETIAPNQSIEDYAVRLFEQAGIGQKKQDNGLLVLFAKTERQVRIEVGYQLEEYVTDGYAGDTIRQEMLPAFRRGEYGPGLLAGTTRLINRIAEKRGVTLADVPASRLPRQTTTGGS